MIQGMVVGAGIGLIFMCIGYFLAVYHANDAPAKPAPDPYEKYRNKEGLLSAKAIKESSGK